MLANLVVSAFGLCNVRRLSQNDDRATELNIGSGKNLTMRQLCNVSAFDHWRNFISACKVHYDVVKIEL